MSYILAMFYHMVGKLILIMPIIATYLDKHHHVHKITKQ
jgi:hypothetical protein